MKHLIIAQNLLRRIKDFEQWAKQNKSDSILIILVWKMRFMNEIILDCLMHVFIAQEFFATFAECSWKQNGKELQFHMEKKKDCPKWAINLNWMVNEVKTILINFFCQL